MGPRSRARPVSGHGFTLTELLVSLSIVAILAALAVPALRASLDRADRTVCLSNLRQLGQAFSEYSSDHGHYPAAELEITDSTGRVVERKRWYHFLAPYLDAGPRAWSSGQGRAAIDPVSGVARELVLPSQDDRDQEALPAVLRCPKVAHWEIGRNGAYGYNHQYLGDARVVGTTDEGDPIRRHYPVRSSQIEDRFRTLVLLDSSGTGTGKYRPPRRPHSGAVGNHSFTVDPPRVPERGGDPGIPRTRWGSDGAVAGVGEPVLASRPQPRHRGGLCVLFADGRVDWVPIDDVVEDDSFWNGTGVASPSR